MLNAERMNAQDKELSGGKQSGVLRWPDFPTAVPFFDIFTIYGKISIVDCW